jgi:AbrB family looped-hinge helix DNA binding protein
MYRSKVTSKYQTTIPKGIREQLGLSVADELRWEVRDGEVVVTVAHPHFLKYRGIIEHGPEPIAAVQAVRQATRFLR